MDYKCQDYNPDKGKTVLVIQCTVYIEPLQMSMMLKPHLESMALIASIDCKSRHRLRINGDGFMGVVLQLWKLWMAAN